MTRAELLAQADAADRAADRIFEQIEAKRTALPADYLGCRALIPDGCETEAQRACDLRREARSLRADADDLPLPEMDVILVERERTLGIIGAASRFGVDRKRVDKALSSGITVEEFIRSVKHRL